ncbi:putative glycosyl hydrolase-like family 15 (GHL15) protein [Pseudonocardia sediminis]|uniref:Putative glycosyl hydrolase-like family 15 (GHL15) protein n=2 Tax=Pseudonocardia sediminis TaxID=1397368 RepID=A0A4Q7V590_PSEST|nr:putative glycosyl hydrolase-like family 15 (GHL15) protein [Pseudonocardia sediminis]
MIGLVHLMRRFRVPGRFLVALSLTASVLGGCAAGVSAPHPEPAARVPLADPAVCGLWNAIGAAPTDAQLVDAAQRYQVVILNAWETAAQKRLKALNPAITVLVYKDLSSTRSYETATLHGGLLPTGVDFAATEREHPDWFATDTGGRRVEWAPYPQHWQMAVWNADYQREWTTAVTTEAVRDGWDGVFADNDFASLGFYSDAVLAGTSSRAETDRLLRDGLDRMVAVAGSALAAQGKLFIPNLSEARLYPGRWTEHARFGGAMEENFAQYAGDELLTWQGTQWEEMVRTSSDGKHLNLLVTKTAGVPESSPGAAGRAGFAGAALLAGDRACWTGPDAGDYSRPAFSGYQSLALGEPRGPAVQQDSGVWTREFTGGWVAVNPSDADETVTPPAGLSTTDGTAITSDLTISAADGEILVRR